jgi:hypothetical protein
MGFANYTDLKAEIASWLSRDDVSTSVGGVDTYIDLAEAWLNRNLRTRQMTTSVGTLTVSSGVITHPTAWLGWKAVTLMTTPIVPLAIADEHAALTFDHDNATDIPQRVIVRGDNSVLWPTPDSSSYVYRGIYYRKVPALNVTDNGSLVTSNWVLSDYPDAYLYGSLLQAQARLVGDERIPLWQSAFDRVIAEIERDTERAEYGGSMLTPQPWGVV